MIHKVVIHRAVQSQHLTEKMSNWIAYVKPLILKAVDNIDLVTLPVTIT